MMQVYVAMLSVAGFVCLMLGIPKYFSFVTQSNLNKPLRHFFRTVGWLSLFLAVFFSLKTWNLDEGLSVWLGWLSVAGVVLVFYLPYWPWKAKVKKISVHRMVKAGTTGHVSSRRPWQKVIIAFCMMLLLAVVLWQYLKTPVTPLMRDDAYHGRIGSWEFVLAESDQGKPNEVSENIFIKKFELKLSCPNVEDEVACLSQIRRAFLKVRKPRNLRSAGNLFFGPVWRKRVEIYIPSAMRLEDEFWLTVEAMNGEVHYASIELSDLSPATKRFIKEKDK